MHRPRLAAERFLGPLPGLRTVTCRRFLGMTCIQGLAVCPSVLAGVGQVTLTRVV